MNNKMLNQFGSDWVKVKALFEENAKTNKNGAVPYTPVAFVLVEKKTGVPANTVKSMVDYGLQIGYLKLGRSKEWFTFVD